MVSMQDDSQKEGNALFSILEEQMFENSLLFILIYDKVIERNICLEERGYVEISYGRNRVPEMSFAF